MGKQRTIQACHTYTYVRGSHKCFLPQGPMSEEKVVLGKKYYGTLGKIQVQFKSTAIVAKLKKTIKKTF